MTHDHARDNVQLIWTVSHWVTKSVAQTWDKRWFGARSFLPHSLFEAGLFCLIDFHCSSTSISLFISDGFIPFPHSLSPEWHFFVSLALTIIAGYQRNVAIPAGPAGWQVAPSLSHWYSQEGNNNFIYKELGALVCHTDIIVLVSLPLPSLPLPPHTFILGWHFCITSGALNLLV